MDLKVYQNSKLNISSSPTRNKCLNSTPSVFSSLGTPKVANSDLIDLLHPKSKIKRKSEETVLTPSYHRNIRRMKNAKNIDSLNFVKKKCKIRKVILKPIDSSKLGFSVPSPKSRIK